MCKKKSLNDPNFEPTGVNKHFPIYLHNIQGIINNLKRGTALLKKIKRFCDKVSSLEIVILLYI